MEISIPFAPILADGIGTVISVVFLVIAFISWISNTIAKASAPEPPARRPARPAGGRQPRSLQQEIEQFLNEVNQGEGKPRAQNAGGAPPREAQPRTVPVGGPDRSRPAANRERPRPPERPRERPQREPVRRQPTREAASPIFAEENSTDMRRSAADSGRIELSRLPSSLDFPGDVSVSEVAASPGADLLRDLTTPRGMMQAILAQEVLGKPLALRK